MGRISTSGYCLTCRQRRVKCDRGKPTCQRCAKSGHRCQGYEGLVIRMDKWCPPSAPAKTATPLVRSPPLLEVTSWSSAPVMSRGPASPAAGAAPVLAMPAAADTLDHWVSHYQWAPWWKFVLQLGLRTDASGAAHKAASSLLSGYYAKHKGNNKVFLESRRYYGESLALVSQALTFNSSESLPMLVLPIMIMSMHPYVFDRSIEFEHHIGLGIVLEKCGPVNFQRLPGLFRSCRSIIVCQSYARRERTFLEDPRWGTVPFLLEGKTTMDYLYDSAIYIPGLFQDLHAMRAGTKKNDYKWLAKRQKELQRQLDAWHAKWETERPRNVEVVPEPSPDGSRQTNVHPFLIKYGTVNRAIEKLVHFTSALYLDKLGELVAEGPNPSPASTEPRAPSAALVQMALLCEWVTAELARCRTSCLLAPVPIAIVYCSLKDLGGPGDELAYRMAASCKVAPHDMRQLEGYNIWKPANVPAAPPLVTEKCESRFARGDIGRLRVEEVC